MPLPDEIDKIIMHQKFGSIWYTVFKSFYLIMLNKHLLSIKHFHLM